MKYYGIIMKERREVKCATLVFLLALVQNLHWLFGYICLPKSDWADLACGTRHVHETERDSNSPRDCANISCKAFSRF
jgi:hypothetical protein